MYRLAPLVAAFILAACSGSAADAPVPTEVRIGGLTAGDREALHSLDRAYVKAWREDGTEAQAEALLKLFAPDAIVYPGRGRGPLSGVEELRAFWFPEGAPPTRIRSRRPVAGLTVQPAPAPSARPHAVMPQKCRRVSISRGFRSVRGGWLRSSGHYTTLPSRGHGFAGLRAGSDPGRRRGTAAARGPPRRR